MSLDVVSNLNKFITEIENLVDNRGLDVMDAILYFCEKNDIEIESVASIIKSNQKIKSKLQMEAERLNFLPKRAHLPI